MVWVILAVLCLSFATLGVTVKTIRDVKRTIREKEEQLLYLVRSFIEAPDAQTPSQLAQFVEAMGVTIGSASARSIMASLNAEKSHVAKLANNLSAEIQAEQNPIAALLSGHKRGKGAAYMKLAELLSQSLFKDNHSEASTYVRRHRE